MNHAPSPSPPPGSPFSGPAGLVGTASFVLTFALLALIQFKVPRPMLLLERFIHHAGWVEAVLLAAYGAWISTKLLDPARSPRWRRRIWGIFSAVFFGQLALGMLGLDHFLMTPPKLHFPIPALIVLGPLYRGENFFMLLLFATTLVLVGPTWCSHICYLGSWDSAAAHLKKKVQRGHPRRLMLRWFILVLTVGVTLGLRLGGAGPLLAGSLALGFGLGGVAVMVIWSRRTGAMIHCTIYCPVGTLACWMGRLSPFRLKISDGCDACGRCRLACRYQALEQEHLLRKSPGSACTLCGDCLHSCEEGFLAYHFPGLSSHGARALFVVLISALHAFTLGMAMI